ncbi:tRNA methyltransferase 2 [Allomyces javanicus]|nr:tRNA methyltransferase 2 [Allomyces javanicus]
MPPKSKNSKNSKNPSRKRPRSKDSNSAANSTTPSDDVAAPSSPVKRPRLDTDAPAETAPEVDTDVPIAEADDTPATESAAPEPEPEPEMIAKIVRRIKLVNVNKYHQTKDAKKWLLKQQAVKDQPWVEELKLKKAPKSQFAIITLPTEESHRAALEYLSSLTMVDKGQTVTVQEFVDEIKARPPRQIDANDTRTPLERIADQTTPHWRLPYEEQLTLKKKVVHKAFDEMRKQLKDKKLRVPIADVIASPETTGYRTKCEFAIGVNPEGKRTVGFNSGAFKAGEYTVVSPRGLLHVNDTMITAAEIIESFVRQYTDLPVYDKTTNSGFFRLVLMRTPSTGQNMVVLQANGEGQTPEALAAFEKKFLQHFKKESEKRKLKVHVLGVQYYSGVHDQFAPDVPVKVLEGPADATVEETLFGFKFTISPSSFFQINHAATEVLYKLVRDWAAEQRTEGEDKETTLLDLCCGTGTIGICMSPGNYTKIVGIDIVPEAIEDAKANAKRNGVENVSYLCGPVEKMLGSALAEAIPNSQHVVVLDPPRSGVHQSVIKSIRQCSAIDKIVFVSCDVKQAVTNFVDLCRPTSARFQGVPFRPVRAAVVDMFPHTKHFETVLEFHRVEPEATEEAMAEASGDESD